MRRAAGFTLVEVLVALAIVAVGMGAVLGALSSSADTLSYLRDKTLAQWVALNQIATQRLSGAQAPLGKSAGEIDFAGRSWQWQRDVVATEVPGVVRLDVQVRPKSAKSEDDSGWLAAVSGIQGDAVATPNGYQPDWGVQLLPGQGAPARGSAGGKPSAVNAPGFATDSSGTDSIGSLGNNGSNGPGSPDALIAPDTSSPSASPANPPPPTDSNTSPDGNP